jgi:hypothetical protein
MQLSGAYIRGWPRQDEGNMDNGRRRAGHSRVRHDARGVPVLGDREHGDLQVRLLPLRQDPRLGHRPVAAQHDVLLPVQLRRVARVLLPDAAGHPPHQVCHRR